MTKEEQEDLIGSLIKHLAINGTKVNFIIGDNCIIHEHVGESWNEEGEQEGQGDFSSLVSIPEKAEVLMEKLHEMIDRQSKPYHVVMPIRAAMDAGLLGRPSYRQFCKEFGNEKLKSKSSLIKYTNPEYCYTGEDFDTLVKNMMTT